MNINVKKLLWVKLAVAIYAAMFSAFGASADNVNAVEARNRAAQFLGLDKSRSSNTLTLEYSASRLDSDDAAYYVFNDKDAQSFVIVAGNDAVKPILGYSYESSFDPDNIPPALQWLLEGYREEISSLPSGYVQPLSRSEERAPIEPLITTKW